MAWTLEELPGEVCVGRNQPHRNNAANHAEGPAYCGIK